MPFQHLLRRHEQQVYQKYILELRDLFHTFHEHKSILCHVIHQKSPHQYRAWTHEMDSKNAQKVIHNEVDQYR